MHHSGTFEGLFFYSRQDHVGIKSALFWDYFSSWDMVDIGNPVRMTQNLKSDASFVVL